MTGYLTCTRCFRETHSKPDWGNIGAQAAIDLCENWLCDDCLDQIDAEAISRGEAPPSRPSPETVPNRGGGR